VNAPGVRTLCVPRLLHVAAGCLGEVGPLLGAHEFDTSRVLVGCGPGPSRNLAARVISGLRAHGADVVEETHLVGRLEQAASCAATIIEREVTVVVAVGGGRVIDPLKLAAARTGVDFVSVPTTISNDGISSPVASLVGRDGVRASHAAQMPCGVIVDVDAIGGAPAATLRAGVGDLVSNLVACLDWRLADREGAERFDAFSAMIAESAARPGLDLRDLTTPESHERLAHGLLLSGLAMATAGTSRPCSGSEHLISHALDAQLGPRSALHGEQVALGCLIALAAHQSPLLETFRALFTRLGLPTRPQALGMSDEQLVDATLLAHRLRPDRWTVLSLARHQDRDAVEQLVGTAFAGDVRDPALV
jgi:glycerol-1-phosphate dehydrogenase [NAD(P)+]